MTAPINLGANIVAKKQLRPKQLTLPQPPDTAGRAYDRLAEDRKTNE
jgi:hypothetical protein